MSGIHRADVVMLKTPQHIKHEMCLGSKTFVENFLQTWCREQLLYYNIEGVLKKMMPDGQIQLTIRYYEK